MVFFVFGVHDTAATRGQYLALSKAWQFVWQSVDDVIKNQDQSEAYFDDVSVS